MTTTLLTDDEIFERFSIFRGGTGGLDSWLGHDTPEEVFAALREIEDRSVSRSLLNQMLTLAHEAPVSEGFFRYYWLTEPHQHPYKICSDVEFDMRWIDDNGIASLDHLYWGLYRFYVDALFYFGSIRTGFQALRGLCLPELEEFFSRRRIDTHALSRRGDSIELENIARDNRYLISEMACKSFDHSHGDDPELRKALVGLAENHFTNGGGPITIGQLLTGAYRDGQYDDQQMQFDLSVEEIIDDTIVSEADLTDKIDRIVSKFSVARTAALTNTNRYLSMVGDLDVYVATSMRTREDFRKMANLCDEVFGDQELREYYIRYFDPTLSAASHHEDKGLIECLMVKCAKVLLLCAGDKDSYGKDAEAAMALSLGKPVIIYTDDENRRRFFRDVHPLSRLIEFETGVAIGAMVTTTPSQIKELLVRILSNGMEYQLTQPRPNYLVLKEKLTGSAVRLQTSDRLLRETFWNYYHNRIN